MTGFTGFLHRISHGHEDECQKLCTSGVFGTKFSSFTTKRKGAMPRKQSVHNAKKKLPWYVYDANDYVKSVIKFVLQPGRVNAQILCNHHSYYTIPWHCVVVMDVKVLRGIA